MFVSVSVLLLLYWRAHVFAYFGEAISTPALIRLVVPNSGYSNSLHLLQSLFNFLISTEIYTAVDAVVLRTAPLTAVRFKLLCRVCGSI